MVEFLLYSLVVVIIIPMFVYMLVRVGSSAFFKSFQEFLSNKQKITKKGE